MKTSTVSSYRLNSSTVQGCGYGLVTCHVYRRNIAKCGYIPNVMLGHPEINVTSTGADASKIRWFW